MGENIVENCFCETGFEKGAIKKSCEFEEFSIFGNLMKKNTIVIRYYGKLAQNLTKKIILSYYFNNDYSSIHQVELSHCKHDKNSYCVSLDLKDNMSINFDFNTDNVTHFPAYSLKIANNTIDDIMKRYNLEQNEELPVIVKSTGSIQKIFNIFSKILSFLKLSIQKQKSV